MTCRSNLYCQLLLAAAFLFLAVLSGTAAKNDLVSIKIPSDIPLQALTSDFENSELEPRGGALIIQLEGSIQFRYQGSDVIRAITLEIDTQGQMLGGRAVVALPSLDISRGETFPVHLNLRMLRPLPRPAGPLVHVTLDGILFDSLAFSGPDRLGSSHKMRVRELEARRDRAYFFSQMEKGGRQGLVTAMQASLRRQSTQLHLEARVVGEGPAIAAGESREIKLSMIQDDDAPLLLEDGKVFVRGVVSDTPSIRLRNRSVLDVQQFELGWLVGDEKGNIYSAGAVPVDAQPGLPVGSELVTSAKKRFRLNPGGNRGKAVLQYMSAYVRHALLSDGSIWIPSRSSLEASRLLDVAPVSVEEQRLTRLYREQGPSAVAAEIRKLSRHVERNRPNKKSF